MCTHGWYLTCLPSERPKRLVIPCGLFRGLLFDIRQLLRDRDTIIDIAASPCSTCSMSSRSSDREYDSQHPQSIVYGPGLGKQCPARKHV